MKLILAAARPPRSRPMPARAGLILAFAVALLAVPAAPVQAAEPELTVSPSTGVLGDTVTVRLTGWPAGVVTAALCGNDARNASADCAVASGAAVQVPASGAAQVSVRLVAPPAGCPCVIRASAATGAPAHSVAIDVPDVPDSATVALPGAAGSGAPRSVVVSDAEVTSRWSFWALLGGPADRTLAVTVTNTGAVPVTGAELTLDLGRAAGDRAPPAIDVGPLDVDAQRRIEVPFTVAAPAFGRYAIDGRVDGAGGVVTFQTRTSSWPWLLPLLPFAIGALTVGLRRLWRAGPLRAGGVTLIAGGVACAVVLAGQTLLPGRETAAAQENLDDQLSAAWARPEAGPSEGTVQTSLDSPPAAPPQGQPMAVMHVPGWGARYTVIEGIRTGDLRKGPGHYPGTALPGEIGNVAVAGHRGPAGEPFNDIDRLRAGDPIVLETAAAWHVYRVERHVIVTPDRVEVVAPEPGKPGAEPTRAMLTMTACHPRYSSRQRYVLYSVLESSLSKAEGKRPAALDE